MSSIENLRNQMVDRQIAARGINDAALLDAMRIVPREEFVPPDARHLAYIDNALPIGEGQTISQPLIVAMMIAAARIRPGDRVLEVGVGSAYAAAIMARMGAVVFAIERQLPLVEAARERLARLGIDNIDLRAGDGSIGLPELAPFDAILVSAAGPQIPDTLKQQLVVGGRLVMPIGKFPQMLIQLTRTGEGSFDVEELCPVTFVPLIGAEGWSEGT